MVDGRQTVMINQHGVSIANEDGSLSLKTVLIAMSGENGLSELATFLATDTCVDRRIKIVESLLTHIKNLNTKAGG